MPDAIPSEEKRDEAGRFIVPPKSPGRPVGSRNKLTEQFVADIHADWEIHGVKAIEEVRAKSPTDYLKIVAGVITKDVAVTVRDYDELSDDDLAEQFALAAARLARGHAPGGRNRETSSKAQLPN